MKFSIAVQNIGDLYMQVTS